jgi:photosystem II stability/assembly factor-like uncharacterized protein
MVWPPADPVLSKVVDYNFVGLVRLDPTDHLHLILTFHAECSAPHTKSCWAESHDGGDSWKLLDLDPSWTGGEGQFIWFLEDGQHLLFSSQTNGLWRSENGGSSWMLIDKDAQGHASGQMVRAKDGTFYLAANGILRSPDGIQWTTIAVPAAAPFLGLVSDGTTIYASAGYPWGPGHDTYQPNFSSPESDGQKWSPLASPPLTNGGVLAIDPDHHLLYSGNLEAGAWRVVLP